MMNKPIKLIKKIHFLFLLFSGQPMNRSKANQRKHRTLKKVTLTLVASAPKLVAADNSPKKPTRQHTNRTFLSILSLLYQFVFQLSFFSDWIVECNVDEVSSDYETWFFLARVNSDMIALTHQHKIILKEWWIYTTIDLYLKYFSLNILTFFQEKKCQWQKEDVVILNLKDVVIFPY